MDETKVHYGIARAHQLMLTMTSYIESADMDSLNCLLSWKESRTQIKYDPVLGKALAFGFSITLSSQGICVGNVYSHGTDLNLLGNFVLVLWLLRWKLGALSCCIILAVFKRSRKQWEWCVCQSFSTLEQELPSNLRGHTLYRPVVRNNLQGVRRWKQLVLSSTIRSYGAQMRATADTLLHW